VAAVVVTCDPGWWLEPCLRALADQEYPQLAVLVVDAGSADDPTPRVAEVAPSAFVRRVRRRRGFAAAANEALETVEGASYLLLCHDDVVPAAGAVRAMVDEALRSNAAIVTPKLVEWAAPDRLLSVGMGLDHYGTPVPLLERGELDQQQHDVVRDVFFAPSACVLVRADLFATLGGFDPGFGVVGEDADLGWRCRLAGGRVVSAPSARVRHLEATEQGHRGVDGSLHDLGAPVDLDASARVARPTVARADADDAAPPDAAPPDAAPPDAAPPDAAPPDAAPPDDDVLPDDVPRDAALPGPVPPDAAPPDAAERWDLRRWDEEDDAAPAPAAAELPHHVGRRRRPADVWRDDEDEEEWEWSARRRRHEQDLADRRSESETRSADSVALDDLRAEARLRLLAGDSSAARAVSRLAALLVAGVLEAALTLVRRGRRVARRVLAPWAVLLRDTRAIARHRAAARRIRVVPHATVMAAQVHGPSRVRAALRGRPGADDRPLTWEPRRQAGTAAVWVALAVVAFGTRQLLTGHLPTIGELGAWPSAGTLARVAMSGWRSTGLGTSGPAPTALALLAVAGVVFLGHTTLLQHVVVLGMLPLGAWGALRLARPLGTRSARVAACIAYLVVPLPYNAIAAGRWSGLVAYAALPWLLGLLIRTTALAPFVVATGVTTGPGPRPPLSPLRRIVATALLLGAAGAVEPALLPLALLVGLALGLACAVTGARAAARRPMRLAIGGAVGALVLLAPWVVGWLPPVGEWAGFAGPATAGRAAHLSTLLRFQTGPLGAGPLGYALLVVAAFPLLVGRDWRVLWATRLWIVALGSFALAWAAQHGALGIGWPPTDVLLAPAGACLALAAGLGMAAFEVDLPGYHFGWRQAASVIAGAAAIAACLPVLFRSVDGRWRQPSTGYDTVLSWMAAKRADGEFRVLWVGDPRVLPIAGWRLDRETAYATSVDGVADVTDQWPGTSRGPTRLLAQALTLTRRGLTADLGHLLAPMGVRYIVVVDATSPLETSADSLSPVPADLTVGLGSQLDVEALDRAPAFTVYQNDAWAPMRVQLPDGAVAAAQLDDPRAARTVDLTAGTPVLPRASGPTTARGTLAAGAVVEVAQAPSGHWHLRVDGTGASRQPAFGSANLFTTTAGGSATLSYATPIGWRIAVVGDALVWLLALVAVLRGRRRLPDEDADGEPPAKRLVVLAGVGS